MTEVPKIIVNRLRAGLPDQAAHPEADLLTSFVEQRLSATERESLIEHLALCGDCRETIVLALPAVEVLSGLEANVGGRVPAKSVSANLSANLEEAGTATSIWIRLGFPELVWPSLRWAALAAGVVVAASVLLLHPGRLNQARVPAANPQIGTGSASATSASAVAASLPIAASPNNQLEAATKAVAAVPEPGPKKTLIARNDSPDESLTDGAPPIQKAKPALPAAALKTNDSSGSASSGIDSSDKDDDSDARPLVTKADVQIVQRASEILSSESKWNRSDTRKCLPDARTYSLYCALQKATGEVTGKFDHRGAAMQEARFVIDDIAPNAKNYNHRLMDYNNDSTTTFPDVQKFFGLLQGRISKRLGEETQNPGK
jgi:hypothetical protein